MNLQRRAELFQRFDRLTRVPMLGLAVIMVPVLLGPVLFALPEDTEELFVSIDILIWAAFAAELTVKTYLAPSRLGYLRDNWIDVAIVAVPIFRPFRFLRLVRLGLFLTRAGVGFHRLMTRHGLAHHLIIAVGLMVLSAELISIAESRAEGNIQGFGDAMWWAVVTVATVGYGDRYPVTPEGKAIAVFLMLVGITLFGIVTANLAAHFVEKGREQETDARLDEIRSRLERIESQLNAGQRR